MRHIWTSRILDGHLQLSQFYAKSSCSWPDIQFCKRNLKFVSPSIVSHAKIRLLVALGDYLIIISLAFGPSASEVEQIVIKIYLYVRVPPSGHWLWLVVLLSEPSAISENLNDFQKFWSFSYTFCSVEQLPLPTCHLLFPSSGEHCYSV